MGSKSYSTTVVDSSANTATDQAIIAREGSKVGTSDITLGDGASFTTTDFGAIKEAFDFGKSQTATAFDLGGRALTQVGDLARAQTAASAQTNKEIANLAESLKTDGANRTAEVVKWSAVGLVVLGVIAYAVRASQ